MTKKIAELPDFLGDEWDPFVEQMAQEIMRVNADRATDRFQMKLTSFIFKQPVYLVYRQNMSKVQTVLWVDAKDRALIPVSSVATMLRQKWSEGPEKNGYISFLRLHEDTDVPTHIPRTLVSILSLLKFLPLPKK